VCCSRIEDELEALQRAQVSLELDQKSGSQLKRDFRFVLLEPNILRVTAQREKENRTHGPVG